MQPGELSPYFAVEMTVDASYACPQISLEQLLALRLGSTVMTQSEPGENVEIRSGDVLIGKAELGRRRSLRIARLVTVAEKAQ